MNTTDSRDDDRLATVYQQRAARLAARTAPSSSDATTPVLLFKLAPETYAVELASVTVVTPLTACTPVPGGPPWLAGVMNLRGDVRSVIDLRQMIGLPSSDASTSSHLVVLRHEEHLVCAHVDQVERVTPIALGSLARPSEQMSNVDGRYVRGVTSDNVIVLDVPALFRHFHLNTHRTGET
jgi:purine-binding chemotaxis protein CheW